MASSVKSAVERALGSGYQLTPEAFELLARFGDPAAAIGSLLESFDRSDVKPFVIEASHLMPLLELPEVGAALEPQKVVAESPPANRMEQARERPAPPPPADLGDSIRIISGSEDVRIDGTIEDFKQCFLDRFSRLQAILRERGDLTGTSNLSSLPHGDKWQKVKAIGMVTSKRDFKDGSCQVELEDTNDSIKVSFNANDDLKKKVTRLLNDEVVCVSGATKTGRNIIANDIIWPDVSYRQRSTFPHEPTFAALTSDIHIGSKMFMKENFESFIRWLRGEEGEERSKRLAEQTKYLIIAGDLVDGVGIYPNQEEELSITDLYLQYEQAANYLSMVPERIKIIIIPGNHDACRPTLPTPPMYRDYAKSVYDLKNVIMLGDPATVNIEGATFLLTHGRSLDDSIPSLPGCDFKTPQNAMVELLKSRHLAPIFGEKTPLAPEHRDRLIIDPVPDIFHAGHIHVEGVANYRGIAVVNSGTWQAQTKFQLSAGIVPKPCIAPIIDLMSGKVIEMNFNFPSSGYT